MTNATKSYTVEGHGAGTLTRTKAMTRELAWAEAKLCMVDTFHTVKVLSAGVVVFRAFKQADGSWIDAKTCKTVKVAGLATAPLALGCKVKGVYHGVAFTGMIEAFDGSGYLHVDFDVPVSVYGSVRESVCFAPSERYLLEVTERAPADLEIKQFPHDVLGGCYVAKKSA